LGQHDPVGWPRKLKFLWDKLTLVPGSLQLVAWDVPGIKIHLGQVDPGTRDDLTLGQHGPHLLIA